VFNFENPGDIPIKITPCPIIDVVSEIRYKDDIASEIFAGMIFQALEKEGYNCIFQRLPINDTPIAIRMSNLHLKYQAHYVIDIGEVTIRISLSSVSIAIKGTYLGWNAYYAHVKKFMQIIQNLNLISAPERLGLRYSSFFEQDIFDKIEISVKIAKEDLTNAKNYIRTEWSNLETDYTLQLSNHVLLNEDNKTNKPGSLIDIDVSTISKDKMYKMEDCKKLLIKFHNDEKQIFFKMLKPEFLQSLNPEYK
jgi:uncharacterized protein (TIGR04255 family)